MILFQHYLLKWINDLFSNKYKLFTKIFFSFGKKGVVLPRVHYKCTVHNEFFKGCTRNFNSLTNSLFFILGEWLSSFTKYTAVAIQVSSTTRLYYCRYLTIYFHSSHCGKDKCRYLQLVRTSYLKKILKPIQTVVILWTVQSFTFIRSTRLRINFLSNSNFRCKTLKTDRESFNSVYFYMFYVDFHLYSVIFSWERATWVYILK